MPRVSSKAKVKSQLALQEAGVRWYFQLLDELLDNISKPEPALAYCFQRIEMAQRMGLYALLMRNYRTNSGLAWKAVDMIDITRSNFPDLYKNLTGKALASELRDLIQSAETVRDNITHGRVQSSAKVHNAILSCLDYASALNAQFHSDAGFKPIGPLSGTTGARGKPQLDKKISRAVLLGLGFLKSN
jgi:hypothetical protein